jgi:pimeloyl-ACP methyl ester carboxylesterase
VPDTFLQDVVETPDGAPLYFEIHGDGEPAVALCDGLGCDGFAWKYLLPQLKTHHRVVHWHYRGHGRSGMPSDPERLGMSFMCDDLSLVLDRAGMKRAVLFGHSMGVQVALEYHRRQASRVLGLGLLCGSYGHPLDTLHDGTTFRTFFPLIRKVVERFHVPLQKIAAPLIRSDLALEFALTTELNRKLLKREDFVPYLEHLAEMDLVVFVRTLASLAHHTTWDHLPQVDVPTLVAGGEQDRFTPLWLSRRMAAAIPGAELVILPGGSHTGVLEQQELVWRHVAPFLERVAERWRCHETEASV